MMAQLRLDVISIACLTALSFAHITVVGKKYTCCPAAWDGGLWHPICADSVR
jgi:hypothetical protein